jgi:hypothetical protein
MSAYGWYRPWLWDLQDDEARSWKAKAIGAVLARLERAGEITETVANIALKASVSEPTVRVALRELAAAGWLSHRRSRYCVAVTLIPRTAPRFALETQNGTPDRSQNETSGAQNETSGAQNETSGHPLTTATATATEPLNPQGDQLPPAPKGNRQRDKQRDEEQLAAIAASWFPDTPLSTNVQVQILKGARGSGNAKTLADVIAYATKWEPRLLERRPALTLVPFNTAIAGAATNGASEFLPPDLPDLSDFLPPDEETA